MSDEVKDNPNTPPPLRQWAFEQARLMKPNDEAVDVIIVAAEIEAYIQNGTNPRRDFIACVDAALAEVDYHEITGVSKNTKTKVLADIRQWLVKYNAL